jgi:hypothetical protein
MEAAPRQPDETLYAFCQRRERELLHQISALKTQLSSKEAELAHVQSAVRQIGNLGGDNAFPEARAAREARIKAESAEPKTAIPIAATPVSAATINSLAAFRLPTIDPLVLQTLKNLPKIDASVLESLKNIPKIDPSVLEAIKKHLLVDFSQIASAIQQVAQAGRVAALGVPTGAIENLTIKQLTLRALYEHFQGTGATASELREYLQNAHGRQIAHNSISPQLSRLKAEGSVAHDDKADTWRLTTQGQMIAIGHWPEHARSKPETQA